MKIAFVALIALATLSAGSVAGASCPPWLAGPLDNGTAVNGANAAVYASILWDPDGAGPQSARLVVAGAFTSIGGVTANHIAQQDPITGQWGPLGEGFPKVALCMTVWNNQLVVGGVGDNDPGTPDDNIATWDGSTWTSLYEGTSTGSVYTLCNFNGELYAGGNFVIYPTVLNPAYNIAHWNTAHGRWETTNAMGTVPGPIVNDLVEWNGQMWAATWNGVSYPSAVGGVWTYDGTNWSVNVTADNSINALQPFNGELVAAGTFDVVGTSSIRSVMGYNGSIWHSYGTAGMDAEVYTLTVFGGNLYSGGYFTHADGNLVNYIAEWNGSSWQSVGGGTGTSSPYVYTMYPDGSQLVVGGNFTKAGGHTANHLARWDGENWSSFGGGNTGAVLAMTKYEGVVVAGGGFDQSDDPYAPAHDIVAWNGNTLSSFGTGMDNQVNALGSYTFGIGVNRTNELIAGGYFTHAGGTTVNNIARWDQSMIAFPGPSWKALGSGVNGGVLAVERATFSGVANIYAGGVFTQSGATALNYVGRFNGSTLLWESMGGGMNGVVYALKYYNGYLYAGGSFTTAGGVMTGGLARWNGSSWSACNGNFVGTVYALEIYNGQLAIGGDYPGIGSSPNLAMYDGASYSTFGTGGTSAPVHALHAVGSRLYVGGYFGAAGGLSTSNIAYWDGSWHGLTNGTDSYVYAIGDLGPEAEVGGAFTVAGSPPVLTPTWARYNSTGAGWYASQPFSTSRAPGTTVDFTAQPASGYPTGAEQWYKNGNPLSDGASGSGSTITGSATATLDIANVQVGDEGDYQAITPSGCGPDSSNVATLSIQGNTSGVGDPRVLADVFSAIGPNPNRGAGTIAFALARDADVRIRMLDIAGRQVGRFELGHVAAGVHHLAWDARDETGRALSAGMYFVALEANGRPLGNKRITIIR